MLARRRPARAMPRHGQGPACTRVTGRAPRAQRYISTRAMFIDVRELAPGSPEGAASDAAGAQNALRGLSSLFKGLLAACREDALVMEQAPPRAAPGCCARGRGRGGRSAPVGMTFDLRGRILPAA